jgi:RNA polymerase sigma factor (sigma-70 family)
MPAVRLETSRYKLLEATFRQQYTPLWKMSWRILRDPALAEDNVQEAFLTLWSCCGRLGSDIDQPEIMSRYAFVVARNRARRTRRKLQARESRQRVIPVDCSVLSPSFGVELTDLVAQLSPRYRDALVLTATGLSSEELANAMGVSVKTARVVLSRARKSLRDLMSPGS